MLRESIRSFMVWCWIQNHTSGKQDSALHTSTFLFLFPRNVQIIQFQICRGRWIKKCWTLICTGLTSTESKYSQKSMRRYLNLSLKQWTQLTTGLPLTGSCEYIYPRSRLTVQKKRSNSWKTRKWISDVWSLYQYIFFRILFQGVWMLAVLYFI